MFLVLPEGYVAFLLLVPDCFFHIYAKYAQFLMRQIFKLLLVSSFTLNEHFGVLTHEILRHLLSTPKDAMSSFF